MPTILLLQNEGVVSNSILGEIKRLAPDYDLWISRDPAEEDPDRIKEVEVSAGGRPPIEILQSPHLKWHHQQSAGVDWLFKIENGQELPFTITNVSGMHAPQITEHVFGMILAFARNMVFYHKNQPNKEWRKPQASDLFRLPGKTMLILGVGAIGSSIARVAKAHEMAVLGIRRRPEKSDSNVDRMGSLFDLDTMLPEADIVVSVLPRSPGTENVIAAGQFALMKPNAIIINVGRGSHIDELAMAEALQSGQIAGAGLDAFAMEPLPENSPLWEMENVIISPHCSGLIDDYVNIALEYFVKNLEQYVKGEPLFNVVDKNLGY